MKCRFTCFVLALLAFTTWRIDSVLGQEGKKVLTVWLIPLELTDRDQTMNFDEFNREAGEDGWVTVLNTTVPHYRNQLIAWNPEFAYPNFPIIKGQRKTIEALRRFAREKGVHINVRFVWWGQAFDELQAITEGKQSAEQDGIRVAPDVAQIGSTWVGYFAKSGAIVPRGADLDRLSWRDTPDVAGASLRYTTDVRLIFYWKRMSYPASANSFKLETERWDSILDSLGRRPVELGRLNPPMAMPIGLTYSVEHDYVPLIWAGGGHFIDERSRKADFTSDAALAIPRKLMGRSRPSSGENARRTILAFPEMTHEEAVHHFLDGEYLAVIEPVNFFARWRNAVAENGLPKGFTADGKPVPKTAAINFGDYAGIAAPPRTFIGGSDLAVTRLINEPQTDRSLSFNLVRFLATDGEYTKTLAELGTLPAQRQQYSIDILRNLLKEKRDGTANEGDDAAATEFAIALSLALSRRSEQEFPALAEWPQDIESREALEAIQRIWRRIGEGGEDEKALENLRDAAAAAEYAINRRTVWWIRLWEDVARWWWAISLTLFLGLVAALNQIRLKNRAAEAQKGKLLALMLYRAKVHEQLQAYGSRIKDFAQYETENLRQALRDYGDHIVQKFNPQLRSIVYEVTEELGKERAPMDLQAIVNAAYEAARIEFKAAWARDAPAVTLDCAEDLDQWQLHRMPHVLIVVLQEWLYNCLKAIAPADIEQPRINVMVREDGKFPSLVVISPEPAEKAVDEFSKPLPASLADQIKGLTLIRSILWFGFGVEAACGADSSGGTILSIPLIATKRNPL